MSKYKCPECDGEFPELVKNNYTGGECCPWCGETTCEFAESWK